MSNEFPTRDFNPKTDYVDQPPLNTTDREALKKDTSEALDSLSRELGGDFGKHIIRGKVKTFDTGYGLRIRDESTNVIGKAYKGEEVRIFERKTDIVDSDGLPKNFLRIGVYNNRGRIDKERSGWVAEDFVEVDKKSTDKLLKKLEKKVKAPTQKPEATPEPVKLDKIPYPGKKTMGKIIQDLKEGKFQKKATKNPPVSVETKPAPELSPFDTAMSDAASAEYEGDYGTALEKYKEADNASNTMEDEIRSPAQKIQEMEQKIQALKDGFMFESGRQFIYGGATYSIGNILNGDPQGNQETVNALSKLSQYEIRPSQNIHKVILTIGKEEIPIDLRGDWQKALVEAIDSAIQKKPEKKKEEPEKSPSASQPEKEDQLHPTTLTATPTPVEGFVNSPYPPYSKLDVKGLPPGSFAMDPTTNRVFKVPEKQEEKKVFKPKTSEKERNPEATKPDTKEAMTYDTLMQRGDNAKERGDFQGALVAYDKAWKTVEGEENSGLQGMIEEMETNINTVRLEEKNPKVITTQEKAITPEQAAQSAKDLMGNFSDANKIVTAMNAITSNAEEYTPGRDEVKDVLIVMNAFLKELDSAKFTKEQIKEINDVLIPKNLVMRGTPAGYVVLPQEKPAEKKENKLEPFDIKKKYTSEEEVRNTLEVSGVSGIIRIDFYSAIDSLSIYADYRDCLRGVREISDVLQDSQKIIFIHIRNGKIDQLSAYGSTPIPLDNFDLGLELRMADMFWALNTTSVNDVQITDKNKHEYEYVNGGIRMKPEYVGKEKPAEEKEEKTE